MNISALIPANLKAVANQVLDASAALLQGETARAIGYGGAALIFLVAKYSKVIPDVSFPEAVAQAGIALALIASLIEPIRHFVSSPATVADLSGSLVEELAAHHPNAE